MREPVVRRMAGAIPNSEVMLNTNTPNPVKNKPREMRSRVGNASINHGRRGSSWKPTDVRGPDALLIMVLGRAKMLLMLY